MIQILQKSMIFDQNPCTTTYGFDAKMKVCMCRDLELRFFSKSRNVSDGGGVALFRKVHPPPFWLTFGALFGTEFEIP